jgi:hypothetical protein
MMRREESGCAQVPASNADAIFLQQAVLARTYDKIRRSDFSVRAIGTEDAKEVRRGHHIMRNRIKPQRHEMTCWNSKPATQ